MDFKQSAHETAVYRRGSGRNVLLVSVYVDDLIIIGTKEQKVEVFNVQMKKESDMSILGLLCFYLGVKVRQDATRIALRQTHYAKRILELGGMIGCNLTHTLMEEKLKLSRESTAEEVDPTHYQRLIGSLRYLVHTRPDIAFAVGYMSRKGDVVKLKVDSKFALALAKNPVFYERSKHIRIKYHFIRDCLEDGSIKASHITTTDQLANILTKSLGKSKF
ncbi:uncharacterized mitochondrial protein AtMg00810-like [Miscanthus floridulus]|uniref:uncharacterized mitochondrial protein AtMg00810-like n=1 Tax=Miscanthus floridulus TaxID=154761 RepID=UPI003458CB6B